MNRFFLQSDQSKDQKNFLTQNLFNPYFKNDKHMLHFCLKRILILIQVERFYLKKNNWIYNAKFIQVHFEKLHQPVSFYKIVTWLLEKRRIQSSVIKA